MTRLLLTLALLLALPSWGWAEKGFSLCGWYEYSGVVTRTVILSSHCPTRYQEGLGEAIVEATRDPWIEQYGPATRWVEERQVNHCLAKMEAAMRAMDALHPFATVLQFNKELMEVQLLWNAAKRECWRGTP